MNRKEFIVKSCAACIGATALSTIVSSCAATQFANGKLTKDGILIDVNEFALKEKDVIQLMRDRMKRSSFEMWRKRMHGKAT